MQAHLAEELETPAGEPAVRPVAAIGVVEVEDGFDGFRGLLGEPFVADVEGGLPVSGVDVSRDDLDARSSKGSTTFSE